MQKTSQNLIKITECLSDGGCHDGTSIGAKLNITRAAVWKALKKLEHYGIALESIKGKGYLLQSPLILLDKEKINSSLTVLEKNSELQSRTSINKINASNTKAKKILQLEVFEKIGSTNDYLKEILKNLIENGTSTKYIKKNKSNAINDNNKNDKAVKKNKIRVCMAEMQSQGKGRLGRRWYSPFGQNIYLSMLYPFEKDVSELTGLSLVVALSICDAIGLMLPSFQETLSVKWPNDVLINGSKLAGTLIEIQAESNGFCNAIIGIGINVNMEKANKSDINQNWSSLLQVAGRHLDRNRLAANLISSLMDYLQRFSCKGLGPFLDEWKERDILFGRKIALSSGGKRSKAFARVLLKRGICCLRFLIKTSGLFLPEILLC